MKDFLVTLIDRKDICENTVAFWFDTKDINYKFDAGQYAHFTIIEPKLEDKEGYSRPLSIASSPDNKDTLMIAARRSSSVFINNLSSVPIGTKVYMSYPQGNLRLHKDITIPSVFIAGGIGVTPARIIIENIIEARLPHHITLFYSNKTESQTAFLNEFEKWSGENENFKFIPTIEDSKNKNWSYEFGTINEDMLKKYIEDIKLPIYYVTGPPVMIDSMDIKLQRMGIGKEKIRTEKF